MPSKKIIDQFDIQAWQTGGDDGAVQHFEDLEIPNDVQIFRQYAKVERKSGCFFNSKWKVIEETICEQVCRD